MNDLELIDELSAKVESKIVGRKTADAPADEDLDYLIKSKRVLNGLKHIFIEDEKFLQDIKKPFSSPEEEKKAKTACSKLFDENTYQK